MMILPRMMLLLMMMRMLCQMIVVIEWNNDHESFANINEQFMSIKTSIFYQIIW